MTSVAHTLCVAHPAKAPGDKQIRDVIFDGPMQADATAECEVLGLLDSAPALRPVDILTSAASPSLTSALDVGVAAPHAAHAGDDGCETMRLRKLHWYRDYVSELEHQGIEQKHPIW